MAGDAHQTSHIWRQLHTGNQLKDVWLGKAETIN